MAYKDKGVVFLGVFAMSNKKDIRKYTEKLNLTYPVGIEDGIADALEVKGIPRTLFIDKEMRIVARHSGTISPEELKSGIDKIFTDDRQRQASMQIETENSDDC